MPARRGPGSGDGAPTRSAVNRSLRHFALWSLALLVVVATGTALVVGAVAREEVLRDARRLGSGIGHGIVEPLLSSAFLARHPEAVAAVDSALRHRMWDGSITRIKIWDERGMVLWSDDARLVGRSFQLASDHREQLRTGGVGAQ